MNTSKSAKEWAYAVTIPCAYFVCLPLKHSPNIYSFGPPRPSHGFFVHAYTNQANLDPFAISHFPCLRPRSFRTWFSFRSVVVLDQYIPYQPSRRRSQLLPMLCVDESRTPQVPRDSVAQLRLLLKTVDHELLG
jgi:hypothetical protein